MDCGEYGSTWINHGLSSMNQSWSLENPRRTAVYVHTTGKIIKQNGGFPNSRFDYPKVPVKIVILPARLVISAADMITEAAKRVVEAATTET